MAILAANKSGLEFKKIINVIHKIKPVEGRLEKIGKTKNQKQGYFRLCPYTCSIRIIFIKY